MSVLYHDIYPRGLLSLWAESFKLFYAYVGSKVTKYLVCFVEVKLVTRKLVFLFCLLYAFCDILVASVEGRPTFYGVWKATNYTQ